ncbi:MAG: hypothetical protein QF718_01830 [Phycisphaerales bacterium]|jgi:hypothetical protein|nr:hypothetical protein [Phycisphaerales bacterium]|tara:strand:+ start:244 stop:453 length:210 start_codon:yes stop_codon:yes gene_type:complete
MSNLLPLLLIVAALLLLIGVLGIVAIVLVAKKCSCRPDNKNNDMVGNSDQLDPWSEAGNRLNNENSEHG